MSNRKPAPGLVESSVVEVAWTLIAAARNCNDLGARATYAARARVLIDKAASDLAELRLNLEIVERGLQPEAKSDA